MKRRPRVKQKGDRLAILFGSPVFKESEQSSRQQFQVEASQIQSEERDCGLFNAPASPTL